MNRQEIFSKVKSHLLTQMKRSVLENADGVTVCCYRSTDGLQCAVGCLLPDEIINPETNCLALDSLLSSSIEAKEVLGDPNPGDILFLNKLQAVHDKQDPSDWSVELAEVARYFSLKYDQN